MAYRHAYLELFRIIGEKLELTEGQRTQWLQFLTDVETWDSGSDASLEADHGELEGLDDDDHPLYHNDDRADTWVATKDITDLSTYDHTQLTSVGVNTHDAIDLHLAHATGHPNSVVSSSEPADGTLAINEGAFWLELV